MVLRKSLKFSYFGFLGLLGLLGFQDQWYFLFFLFFLFFLATLKSVDKGELIERQAQEKAEHKQKIIEFFEGKEKVSNNDIEKLLGVSDATAERYLNELEKEGVLRQKGESKGIYYEKTR